MSALRVLVPAYFLVLLTAHAHAQSRAPSEPDVRAVVAMALKAARHTAPGRADELGKRARLAGLVPQVRLAARRGLQQDQSSTSTLSDDRTNASLGDDLTLEAGLTFQLDRLVFAPEQVRLLAVERWLAADRRKLIEDVVHLFFRRARLTAERRAAQGPDAVLDADIAELEALLDAYTDGAFGVALSKASAELAKAPTAPTTPVLTTRAPVASPAADASAAATTAELTASTSPAPRESR